MNKYLIVILFVLSIIFTIFGHLFKSGIEEMKRNDVKIVEKLKRETIPFSEVTFHQNIHYAIIRISSSDVKNKWLNISGVISRIGFVSGFWVVVLVFRKCKFLLKKLWTNSISTERDKSSHEPISKKLASSIQLQNPFFIKFLKKCLFPSMAIFLSFIVISLNFLDILISPISPVVKAIAKFFDLLSVFFPWLDGYIVVLIVIFCYILYLLFLSTITGFISFKIWYIIKLKNINKSELIQTDLLNEEDIYKFFRIAICIILGIIFLTSCLHLQEPLGLPLMFS